MSSIVDDVNSAAASPRPASTRLTADSDPEYSRGRERRLTFEFDRVGATAIHQAFRGGLARVHRLGSTSS